MTPAVMINNILKNIIYNSLNSIVSYIHQSPLISIFQYTNKPIAKVAGNDKAIKLIV